MTNEIIIEYITDEVNCETCGWDCASGYLVTINGVEYDDLTPVASCLNPYNYSIDDVLKLVLDKTGVVYTLTWIESEE